MNDLVTPLPEVETRFICCNPEQNLAGIPFRSKEHNYIISSHLLPVRLRPFLRLNISVFLTVYQSVSLVLLFVILVNFFVILFVVVICIYFVFVIVISIYFVLLL